MGVTWKKMQVIVVEWQRNCILGAVGTPAASNTTVPKFESHSQQNVLVPVICIEKFEKDKNRPGPILNNFTDP